MAELSVVLPAYEEAENLRLLLPRIRETVAQLGVVTEIIVIDAEQSKDETAKVCAANNVVYRRRVGGGLYGHAIRTAQRIATGRYVAVIDADGSHAPELLPRLWAHREAADIVIASRYVPGGSTDNPGILILLSHAVNIVFKIALGVPCADVSNSFRLYRGEEFRAVQLECDNFDIVEELLVKLFFSRPGYRLTEVPFRFERRNAGRTKRKLFLFALGYVGTLARLHRLKRKALAGEAFRR